MKWILSVLLCLGFSMLFAQQTAVKPLKQNSNCAQVFPNPVEHSVSFHFASSQPQGRHLYLLDLHGKVVRTFGGIKTEHFKLSLIDLAPGVYLYEVRGLTSCFGRIQILGR